MRSPKATPEDPAVVAAREREQARAEAARTEETQALTLADTIRRIRRFGKLPGKGSGGSVPIYAGTGSTTSSSASSGSTGGVYSAPVGGGGSSSGSAQMNTVLY